MRKSSRCASKGRKPLSDVSNGEKISRSCKQEADEEPRVSIQDRLVLAREDLSKIVSEVRVGIFVSDIFFIQNSGMYVLGYLSEKP